MLTAEAQASRGRWTRRWWVVAVVVVALAAVTLSWGYFSGTHTDISPATHPFVGRPEATTTDADCPVGPTQAPNAISLRTGASMALLLVAPGGYVKTTHPAAGETDTAWYFPELPLGGKLRVIHRWFRPTGYAYTAQGTKPIPLHPVQLGPHSCPDELGP